ncbi:hypothetical protein SKAU_G00106400 [Synaphobranchus kaupii]|uniref:Uncharacterized protein n=1 Tax=Synaphobranchus kaupii TaxID=118154 RepID=A0A9Q1G087_SYNKA|nr:hypothetical protein SKAU_G00106400 [Synaphobranchus kaupii]
MDMLYQSRTFSSPAQLNLSPNLPKPTGPKRSQLHCQRPSACTTDIAGNVGMVILVWKMAGMGKRYVFMSLRRRRETTPRGAICAAVADGRGDGEAREPDDLPQARKPFAARLTAEASFTLPLRGSVLPSCHQKAARGVRGCSNMGRK